VAALVGSIFDEWKDEIDEKGIAVDRDQDLGLVRAWAIGPMCENREPGSHLMVCAGVMPGTDGRMTAES
jgi:hypothetical protein